MLVSIVIPSFEQSEHLDAAILSARRQTYGAVEIIVVDDAGRDPSLAVALEHARADDRVRVVRRRVNGGLGRARNTGIALAQGELLGFLDSDDCLFPNSVAERVASFRARRATSPDCVGVFGDWQHTTERVDLPDARAPRQHVPDVTAATFVGENSFICSAPLVLADAVRRVGGFPVGLPLFEDYALWARIIADGGVFHYTPVMASTYRQRPASMLRRSDVIGSHYASAIVDGVRARGVRLAGSGTLARAAAAESPRTGQRLAWLRATEFVTTSPAEFGSAASVLSRSSAVETPDRGDRSSGGLIADATEELADAAADAVEIHPFSDEVLDGREVRTVLVPSSVEAALEVVAVLAHSPAETARRVAIAVPDGTDLVDVWPCLHVDAPVVTTSDAVRRCPDARWVVFGDDDDERRALIDRIGKESCVVRTSGARALRAFDAGAARRFRSVSATLVRTALEAGELGGDRRVVPVASGARFGLEAFAGPDPAGPTIVVVPGSFIDEPRADGWLSTVLRAADEVAGPTHLFTTGSPACDQGGFKVRPLSLSALEGVSAIVSPLADVVTLFEALGLPVVVYEPSPDPRWNTTWVRHLAPARDAAELRTRLLGARSGGHAVPGFASRRAAVRPFDGAAAAFAASFLSAAGVSA